MTMITIITLILFQKSLKLVLTSLVPDAMAGNAFRSFLDDFLMQIWPQALALVHKRFVYFVTNKNYKLKIG